MSVEFSIAIMIGFLGLIGTLATAIVSSKNKSNSVLFGASESIRRDVMDANSQLNKRMDRMEKTILDFRNKFHDINDMLSYVALRIDLLIKHVDKSISDHDGEETPHIDNLIDMKDILKQIEQRITEFKNDDQTG
jgi:hypothetical protein